MPEHQGDIDRLADEARRQMGPVTSQEAAEREHAETLFGMERGERYAQREHSHEQQQPQEAIIMNSTQPLEIRHAFRSLSFNMERATTEAPLLGDRYRTLRFYWIAQNRASALKDGLVLTEEQKRSLESQGIAYWRMVPPLEEMEEFPVPRLIRVPEQDDPDYEEAWKQLTGSSNPPELVRSLTTVEINKINMDRARERKAAERKNEQIRKLKEDHRRKEQDAEARREPLVKELERSAAELSARSKLDYDFQRYEAAGGSIDEIAQDFLQPRSYHVLATDYHTIFNAPDRNSEDPNNHGFGEAIDKAMRAYYIIGLSERPDDLSKLARTQGFRRLFGDNQDEIERWIGKVGEWTRQGQRKAENVQRENNENKRGLLTSRGNVWSRKESVQDREVLRGRVREFIGTSPDADAAEEIAYRLFRTLGMSAALGTERYGVYDDRGNLVRGKVEYSQEGFPESDDLVKVMDTDAWQLKQIGSGHAAGPDEVAGKIPRLAVDFFRFTTHEFDPNNVRSFNELWWGGEGDPNANLGIDTARNLGQLPWLEKTPTILREWRLRLFFAGRKGGLLDKWIQVSKDPSVMGHRDFWRDMQKALNIVYSPSVVFNGELRGKSSSEIKRRTEDAKLQFKDLYDEGMAKTSENAWWYHSIGKIPTQGTVSSKEAIKTVQKRAGYRK